MPTGAERLRTTLPPLFGATGWMAMLIAAIGARFDELDAAQLSLLAQRVISTVTWGAASWERDLGLPSDASLDLNTRIERIQAQYQGIFGAPLSLEAFVAAGVDQDTLPTTFIERDQWLVYKLGEIGWPGDEAFALTEEGLGQRAPAHVGAYLAPWDSTNGLLPAQLDQMHAVAIDQLTPLEIDGPPLGETWLHVDADALAWSAVDSLALPWSGWDRRPR